MQDFINAIDCKDYDSLPIREVATREAFDAILSQARQEARREALKEMDEAKEAYQQAKAYGIGDVQSYMKLRSEYMTGK